MDLHDRVALITGGKRIGAAVALALAERGADVALTYARSKADWDAVLDVDLRSAFLCARAAVPHMRAQGGGRIINFSDWTARSGRPRYVGFLPYYVAKSAVIALTEALALELAGENIL